jgi:hypothetical protein
MHVYKCIYVYSYMNYFEVSGFKCRVQVLGLRVQGSGFRRWQHWALAWSTTAIGVWRLGSRVQNLYISIYCFYKCRSEVSISGVGFRLSGFGFRILGFGIGNVERWRDRRLRLGFGVLGFGVWSLGFGVWSLKFGVRGLGLGIWGLGFRF